VVAMRGAGWPGAVEVTRGCGRDRCDDQVRAGLRRHFGEPVSRDWKPGHTALFRWGKGEPSHVGIIGDHPHGGLSIIHASNLRNVVETSLTGRLLDCVIEVYRPRWSDD